MYILHAEEVGAVSGGKNVLEEFAIDIAGPAGTLWEILKNIGTAVYIADKAMSEIGLQEEYRNALAGGNLGA